VAETPGGLSARATLAERVKIESGKGRSGDLIEQMKLSESDLAGGSR